MTTHDQQTLTGSHEQPETAGPGTPPASEPTEPAASADPTTAPAAPADPSTASREPAPSGGVSAPSAEDPSTQRESSTEELLFADDDLAELRARWAAVQASFVDDPKDCVHKADVLVSDLVEQLTSGFAHARSRLEEQWARGEEASTEDLRVALMHYREFFQRLLAV
jgi:hypothetical protein